MKVRDKSKVYEAYQWNGESVDKLPTWVMKLGDRLVVVSGEMDGDEPTLLALRRENTERRRTIELVEEVHIGMWIVTDQDKAHSFDICDDETFKRRYEDVHEDDVLLQCGSHDSFSIVRTLDVKLDDFITRRGVLLRFKKELLRGQIETKGKIATISEIGNAVLDALGCNTGINRADIDRVPAVTE